MRWKGLVGAGRVESRLGWSSRVGSGGGVRSDRVEEWVRVVRSGVVEGSGWVGCGWWDQLG